jgi:hypothetical protein
LSPHRDQESINVLPDFFPPGQLRITAIRVDGVDRTDELVPANPNDFQIPIGNSHHEVELAVEFTAHITH